MAKCPLCKDRVERSFLEGFENAKRLNMRQQARFCKAHRARTAEVEWEAKGYPKIDWEHFDRRLAKFHTDLENILRGKKPSYYQNAFENHLKSGQDRTLQQKYMGESAMDGLDPGYYGSKGAKLMYVFFSFAIRSTDSTSFPSDIQSISTPFSEICTRLSNVFDLSLGQKTS